MRTMEELGDELCKYCPLDDEAKGTHVYDGFPSDCTDSGYCEIAYSYYQDECTETCVACGEKVHPEETEHIRNAADDMYGPLCQKCYEQHGKKEVI